MTEPLVKTAMESDEARVIDELKRAFAADPQYVGFVQIPRSIFHISQPLSEPLEEKHLQIREPTTLETILAQLYGFHQMFTPRLTS